MTKNPLGTDASIPATYTPEILFAIDRDNSRRSLGAFAALPFSGCDVWNCYEFSWLDAKGKPISAGCRITYDCYSPRIVESKSLKLYLYGLNQTRFADASEVSALVQADLAKLLGDPGLSVEIIQPADLAINRHSSEVCIDQHELSVISPVPNVEQLKADPDSRIAETLFSETFRSLCPVTAQPDWATVTIKYEGPRLDQAALLAYLVSYRSHQGFHEDCCERIFIDLVRACRPDSLSVMCRFLRRGGIDINPIRSSLTAEPLIYMRDARQ